MIRPFCYRPIFLSDVCVGIMEYRAQAISHAQKRCAKIKPFAYYFAIIYGDATGLNTGFLAALWYFALTCHPPNYSTCLPYKYP